MARGQERRVHAEAKMRLTQAALDVKVEERRAEEARVASLEEMARLSLVKGKGREGKEQLCLGHN